MAEDMPDYLARMVDEYTELVYRVNALEKFMNEHEPGTKGEDGVELDEEEYDLMNIQFMAMCSYGHCLWMRGKKHGFEFKVLADPTKPVEDAAGTDTDS